MSTLVPEKRPNKHGVMVTKYVRQDSPETTAPGNGIPAPAPVGAAPAAAEHPMKQVMMTMKDFELITEVLDLCGTYQSDDIEYAKVFIRDGNLRGLKVMKEHGDTHSFSTIHDIINATDCFLSDDDTEYPLDSLEAHLKVADSGAFEYYDPLTPGFTAVARLIHENPEKAESIIAFLEDRGVDAEGLSEYLGNDVAALRKGTL
jgi:hypothetical protein